MDNREASNCGNRASTCPRESSLSLAIILDVNDEHGFAIVVEHDKKDGVPRSDIEFETAPGPETIVQQLVVDPHNSDIQLWRVRCGNINVQDGEQARCQ